MNKQTKWSKFVHEISNHFFFWCFGIIYFLLFRLIFILYFNNHVNEQSNWIDIYKTFLMGFRFDSTVTAYFILIPFLLIPQLLLSGVVVKFDQLNKIIRNDIDVPIVGDMMVSRWALESALVNQFVDNEFNQKFYPIDKQISDNRYILVYLLPTIETLLAEGYEFSKDEASHELAEEKLAVASHEINKLLVSVGKSELPEAKNINLTQINQDVVDKSMAFLKVYREFILKRQKSAISNKDAITAVMVNNGTYESLKNKYHNDVVAQTVTNSLSLRRIEQKDGKLHRISDPIFNTGHQPKFLFDYRTPLYVPIKYLAGIKMSTTYYNIIIIWLMSLFLILALYNDWLKKLFRLFDKKP